MEETNQLGTILTAVYSLVGLGLVGALALLCRWLAARAAESTAFRILSEAMELAQSVVAHVEVHLRPTMRGVLADGKLTPVEREKIKEEALGLLRVALAEKGLERLRRVVGPGLEVYLSGLIERALGLQRRAGTLPPPASPVADALGGVLGPVGARP